MQLGCVYARIFTAKYCKCQIYYNDPGDYRLFCNNDIWGYFDEQLHVIRLVYF